MTNVRSTPPEITMLTSTGKNLSGGRLTYQPWCPTPKVWTPVQPVAKQQRSTLLDGLIRRTGVTEEVREPKLVEQFESTPGRASRRQDRTTRGTFSKSVQKQVGTVKNEAFTIEVVPPETIRTQAQLEDWMTHRVPSDWESKCLETFESTGIAMDDIFLPEVIRLRDEFVAVVGGDLKNALFLSIFDPAMARARITAVVQAQLSALADEAAPAPAQHRARARL